VVDRLRNFEHKGIFIVDYLKATSVAIAGFPVGSSGGKILSEQRWRQVNF
jgi:hypothetical protein